MTTTEPRPVPPGVAFQAAGPIVRGSEAYYTSPRDLPQAIKVDYISDAREVVFTMGFRDIRGTKEEGGEVFECSDANGRRRMQLAFVHERRRVAWVKAFEIDLNPEAAELIRGLLRSFQDHVNRREAARLPTAAESTLRLLHDMAPVLISDLGSK